MNKRSNNNTIKFNSVPRNCMERYRQECTEYYCNELLKYKEFRKHKDALKASRKEVDRYLSNKASFHKLYFYDIVLSDTETPIGYLWYQIEPNPEIGFLMYIIIDEQWRGQKFGHKALQLYEKEAYQRGVTTSVLYVFINNPAVNLYLKNGYIIEKQVKLYQAKQFTRYRMSKRLGPS